MNKEVEPVQPVQMKNYQSNALSKDSIKLVTFQQLAKGSMEAASEKDDLLRYLTYSGTWDDFMIF